MELGRSGFVVRGRDYRYFVGLDRVHDDAEHADLYWLWVQINVPEAEDPTWTLKASKQEQYDYALSHCTAMDPKFAQIIRWTKPEGIHTPALILRDMIMEEMPNSRITLLGDAIHPMTPCESCRPILVPTIVSCF